MVRGQYKGDIKESDQNDVGHNRSTGEEEKLSMRCRSGEVPSFKESRGATSEGRQHTAEIDLTEERLTTTN